MTLESEWGSITMRVRLDRHMVPGIVAVCAEGGHTAMGRFASGLGESPMLLCAPDPAPESGASPLCMTRVRLRKGGRRA